jgi:hypothetical protein
MKRNWVDEALDNATRTVEAWPAWMRRPEIRTPGANSSTNQQQLNTVAPECVDGCKKLQVK